MCGDNRGKSELGSVHFFLKIVAKIRVERNVEVEIGGKRVRIIS